MPKVRHKRLRAVQADLEQLIEAAERVGNGTHKLEIARLEERERELLRRIREGSDMDNGAADYQRSKTHCPRGHPYSAGNLIVDRQGHRKCRTCKRRLDMERWYRERGTNGSR